MKSKLSLTLMLTLFSSVIFCQFNWEHTDGPIGGNVYHFYHNDQYAFIADANYLYRSADGNTWEKSSPQGFGPIAVHGSTLVGVQSQGVFPQNTLNLMVSFDNGDNWAQANMPPNGAINEMVACSHGIYVIDYQGLTVQRSQDDGMTWEPFPAPGQYAYQLWASDDRAYLSIGLTDLWRTNPDASGWEDTGLPTGPAEYIQDVLAYGPHLLVGTEGRLWHSHDNGQTWQYHITPWPDQYTDFQLVGNTVYALGGPNGFAKSEDFGLTWQELPYTQNDYLFSSLSSADGKLLIGSYTQGVFRWDEPTQTITEANLGFGSAVVYDLAVAPNEVWAATGNSVYRFQEQQQVWNSNPYLPRLGRSHYETIKTGSNGLVCAVGSIGSKLYISTDSGLAWDTISMSDLTGSPISFGYFDKVLVLDNSIFVFSDLGGYFFSTDLGQSWQVYDGPIYGAYGNLFKKDGKLWSIDHQNGIYFSEDQGQTWTQSSTFSAGMLRWMRCTEDLYFAMAQVQVNGQYYLKLFTSQNSIDWNLASDGLPDHVLYWDPYSIGPFVFQYQGKYFFFSERGTYSSNDGCQTWFPADYRQVSTIVKQADKFYAGGFGGGVYRTNIPTDLYGALLDGTVYKDDNNNGLQDMGETPIPNVRVGIATPLPWWPFYFSNTDENGAYSLGITANLQDTLRPLLPSPYVESINPPFYITDSGGTKNFGIHLTPDIFDLSIAGNYVFRPRPGFDFSLRARLENIGTENEDAVVSVKLDPSLTYITATPLPSAVFGDSLVWDLGAIPVLNGEYVTVKTNVPTTTPLGTWVKSTWRIAGPNIDVNPDNNVLVLCDTVVGSFDPNEKRVQPVEGLTPAEIAAGKEVLYTVHFQNTGTFPAERVRITDLLDTALYLPSLRLVAASHDITSFQLKPGGLLEVVFDNIQLPDSTSNEPESHGFVTFAVQRNKAFNANVAVLNRASIYFDFNEPIVTNEVSFSVKNSGTTDVRPPLARHRGQLAIFPNPANNVFSVSAKDQLDGPGLLTVHNTVGQTCLVKKVKNMSETHAVDVGTLPSGIYFVRMSGDKGGLTGKIVLER